MTIDLLDALVDSQALRLAPPGEVFWYTSGTLGPYYIRTEFLYGGPAAAEDLLAFIDGASHAADFHARLVERVRRQLDADAGYRAVTQALAAAVRARPSAAGADWVSGGERRDWFFSVPVALTLDLPHLYIYKDGATHLAEDGAVRRLDDLAGRTTVHVADLVTEASSYARAWIPALRDRGARMGLAANVVDRAQGGMDVITGAGVDAVALLRVDAAMFGALRDRGVIDAAQHDVLLDYFGDPTGAMRRFLQAHPGFLEDALASTDARTAERARLLVDKDPYGLRAG